MKLPSRNIPSSRLLGDAVLAQILEQTVFFHDGWKHGGAHVLPGSDAVFYCTIRIIKKLFLQSSLLSFEPISGVISHQMED